MSENTNPSAVAEPDSEALRGAQAAGAMLRQAREDAGLHVAMLASALKVTVKKLEALEAGRIDELPDATFARGLAASICRGLKIDPQPVLALMPGIDGSRLGNQTPAINESFEATQSGSGAAWRLPSPALAIVVVLLLGALVMYFYPQQPDAPEAAVDAPVSSAEPVAAVEPLPPVPAVSVAPVAPVAPGTAVAPALPATPATPEPLPVAALPVPVAPAAPAAPASAATAGVAASGDAPLVFMAKAESWVQVTDAQGVAVLRRVLQAGERVPVSGKLPLAVVVGRSEAVEVQVRGQPLSLATIARNNVARFEVK